MCTSPLLAYEHLPMRDSYLAELDQVIRDNGQAPASSPQEAMHRARATGHVRRAGCAPRTTIGLAPLAARRPRPGAGRRRGVTPTYSPESTPMVWPSGSSKRPMIRPSMTLAGPIIRVPPSLSAEASASSASGTLT